MMDPKKLSEAVDNMTDLEIKEARIYSDMAEVLVKAVAESSETNPHRMLYVCSIVLHRTLERLMADVPCTTEKEQSDYIDQLDDYVQSIMAQLKIGAAWIGIEHLKDNE